MDTTEKYRSLISDIIEKQATILGPEIAMIKARNVSGLEIDKTGKVTAVSGDPRKILELLIDEYVNLSGQIVKSTLASVFKKYPGLNHQANSQE